MTGDARTAILGRVRDALGPAPTVPEVPREYRRAGAAGADVDLFCERVAEYRASVHRTRPAELDATIAAIVSGRVVVPAGAPWRPDAGLVVDDPPLTAAELDGVDTVLTGCAVAVAETGTIVLDGAGASGRRALSLIPDHHVCVVGADQIAASVPDAVAVLEPGRPLTFISGPSATSDIELERVEGVHGPRILDVIVVDAD